jgi:hypothetical protein
VYWMACKNTFSPQRKSQIESFAFIRKYHNLLLDNEINVRLNISSSILKTLSCLINIFCPRRYRKRAINEAKPLKPKLSAILFNNSVRTAKKTPHFTVTKINRLTLFKEIIAVYSENHTK